MSILLYWITFTSEKDPKEIYNFYVSAMKDFTGVQKMEMNGIYSVNGNKNETVCSVTINFKEQDGKKLVTVVIAIAPKQ